MPTQRAFAERRGFAALSLTSLCLLAIALTASQWRAAVPWTPDSLYYESQARELDGEPARQARQDVFFGAPGRTAQKGTGRFTGRFTDPRWIEYSARFYRRRWVVPGAAAALHPFFGTRSLELVSLLGYLFSGLALFALIKRRFGLSIATAVASLALLFAPFRHWSELPQTDSVGVLCLSLCLLFGVRALERRGTASIAFWMASVTLLAFTRDAVAVVVFASLFFALAERSKRALVVALAALGASLPAPLLFGAPLRQTIAFTFNANAIPTDASWHFILNQYWPHVQVMVVRDFAPREAMPILLALVGAVVLLAVRTTSARLTQLQRLTIIAAVGLGAVAALPPNSLLYHNELYSHLMVGTNISAGTTLLLAIAPLFLPAARTDTYVRFLRAGAVGAIAYLFLLPQYTGLRLALVLLPFAAVGLARAASIWPPLDGTPPRIELPPA